MNRAPTGPRSTRPRYRLLAGAGLFAASVAGWVALVASDPGIYWQQSDAAVYRQAGLAVRHGARLYAQTFGAAHLPFTYPPFAALIFGAASPLSFPTWQLILAVCGLCCLVLAAHAAVRLGAGTAPGVPEGASRAGRPAAALAIAAVGLWLEPVDLTLHFGQINLILMALVLVDLAAPASARAKGAGIGIAAGLKLTPLIFIPYLLLTRRVRAAALSVACFAGTVALGFAVLGRDSLDYWGGRFAQPGDSPVRLVNQSLNGLVLRVLRDGPAAHTVWLVVALVVGVVGLGAAVLAGRRGRELLGACLCAATGLLVSPISWSHHWVYVVAGLAVVARVPLRRRPAPVSGGPVSIAPVSIAPVSRGPVSGAAVAGGPVTDRVAAGRRATAAAVGAVLVGAALVALFAWWPLPGGPHGGIEPGAGLHPSGLLRIVPHDNGAELRWSVWQLLCGDAYVIAALALVLGSAVGLVVEGRRPRPARGGADAAPALAGSGGVRASAGPGGARTSGGARTPGGVEPSSLAPGSPGRGAADR